MVAIATNTHDANGRIFDDPRQLGLFEPVRPYLPDSVPQKLTIKVQNDPDTTSPSEHDCSWKLYSFNRRHGNFKHPDEFPMTVGLRRKLKVGTAFYLSCYEHGGSVWALKDSGTARSFPDQQFDVAQMAGIMIFENPKDMGAKDYAGRQKDAEGFLDEYNDWSNGNCYYYSLTDNSETVNDSCGGFIGTDTFTSELKDAVAYQLEKHPTITKVCIAGEAKDLFDADDVLPKGHTVRVVDEDDDEED